MLHSKNCLFRIYQILILVVLTIVPLTLSAQNLKVARIFSDHMVMQQGAVIPVWGVANVEEEVHVFFNGITFKTKADVEGYWEISLPQQAAGGPFELNIVSSSEQIKFKNILIGDVWLCSGQSNMEWLVRNSNNAAEEILNGNHSKIRHFKVPRTSSAFPESTLAGGEWQPTTSETVGDFTAVGYFFATEIQESEKIPIGLLNSSWGGSRIEPWISAEDLGFDNPKAMAAKAMAKQEEEKAAYITLLKTRLDTIPLEDMGMQDDVAKWAGKEFDDSNWELMELPTTWEQAGWEKADGVFWFRRTLILPKGMEAVDGILNLGPIDDNDQTWVNGHLVGSTNAYNENRAYKVPAKYLQEGKNSITVRVEDTGGGGGIYGDAKLMSFETNKQIIFLDGNWKYKVGFIQLNNSNRNVNQQPTLLYNKMIHPILKFPIKGVLWYQGESNAGNPTDAKEYTAYFKTLISSWRTLWNIGDFPFLYVQLANFMAPKEIPVPSNWALLRESQSNALALPKIGQAVIIDIGEANDIHPRNKQDVGKRLALAGQKLAYKKDVVFSGPTYKSMTQKATKLILNFNHIGSGLMAKNNLPLGGFSIAGIDKKFVWAEAEIVDNTVEVWAAGITEPIAVRYAWADNPDKANLFNEEGLPASPFRTDDWEE